MRTHTSILPLTGFCPGLPGLTGKMAPPKRHPDPIICFSTAYPPDRQTDRQRDGQTDRWSRRQTCKNTHLRSIALSESDVATNGNWISHARL